MEHSELNRKLKIFAGRNNVELEKVRPIYKDELKVGETYKGECRNSDTAQWNGNRFVYYRCKFGDWFKEEINHFEEDDGYDVFVPIEIIE